MAYPAATSSASSSALPSLSPPFVDNFNSYNGPLNGQGGWTGSPDIPVLKGVVDGTKDPGTGMFEIVDHPISAPGNGANLQLLFNAFAYSQSIDGHMASHNSQLGLYMAGLNSSYGVGWVVDNGIAAASDGSPPHWEFDTRPLGGNIFPLTPQTGFDQWVTLGIVVDQANMQVYGVYDFGQGLQETPAIHVTPTQIAAIRDVEIQEDYRFPTFFLGAKYDNVSVSYPAQSSITAGSPLSFTVSALGPNTTVASGDLANPPYEGTVQFQGVTLPSYTFMPQDRGSHAFTIIPASPGSLDIGVSDTSPNGISGSATLLVSPPAPVDFNVTSGGSSGPFSATAGTPASITVTAMGANGASASAYVGTVHFTSSDPQAGLPADYTFTPADNGSHTFNLTFFTAGNQSFKVSAAGMPDALAGVTVSPASASSFLVTTLPVPVTGDPLVTVTAYDKYGNVAAGYIGTVQLTSSDNSAMLPPITFSPSNQGTQTVSVTFNTVGGQSLAATDMNHGSLTGSTKVFVSPMADLTKSSVSVASAKIQSGGTTTVTLTAVSAVTGQQMTTGGLSVFFGLGFGSGGGTFGPVTDNGNGTYSAVFTGTITGNNSITASIAGLPLSPALGQPPLPSVTITPSVQATVNPVNITYGTALANSQLAGAATAMVNGQSVNVPGTFSYATAAGTALNAGNGQSEQVTFTPTDTTEFSSVQTTVAVNVAQADATVTVTGYSVTYDGKAHSAMGIATGVGGASLPSSDVNLSASTHTNAGTYASNAWTFSDPNYKSQNGTVTDTINQASATVSVAGYSVTYDGSVHTATGMATGVSGASLPSIDINLSATAHANAGTYASDAWTFHDPNGNYGDQSGTVNDTINQATATVTVTGYNVTYDGTVHTATGSATGVGGASLPSSDISLYATAHINAGTYASDAWSFFDPNYKSQNGTVADKIAKDSTSTGVTATPANPVNGQALTFTGTVRNTSGSGQTLTGTVQFFIDGSPFGTPVPLSGSGNTATAVSQAVLNAAGSPHTVTATYTNSDGNFQGGMGSLSETVAKASTHTIVTATPFSLVYGQAVTFTATVAAVAPGTGTPTGTVTFMEGAVTDTVAVTSGRATFTTSSLAVATHTITATYNGDGNFKTGSGSDVQVVNKASSRMGGLAVFPNPAVFGQVISITAVVSPLAPGKGTPTGTVTFLDGSTTLGSMTLTGGRATFTRASLSRGNHALSATYKGDSTFAASATQGYGEPVQKDATTTGVTPSASSVVVGHAVTFTATVKASAPGSGTPTGTVTFKDITTVLGTGTLNSAGQATFSSTVLAVGTHAITASYAGDTNFTSSFAPNIAEVVRTSGANTVMSPPPTNGNAIRTAPSGSQPSPINALSPQSIDRFFSNSGGKPALSTSRVARPHPKVATGDSLDWPV